MESYAGGGGSRVYRISPCMRRRGSRCGVCHAEVSRAIFPSMYARISTYCSAARVLQLIPEGLCMAVRPSAHIVVRITLLTSALETRCISSGLRQRHQTSYRHSAGSCHMIQWSTRTATSATAIGGGMILACISPAKAAAVVRSACDSVSFLRQVREAQYAAAGKQSKAGLVGSELNSGKLYRIPVYLGSIQRMAPECITWPRYDAGGFSLSAKYGESMLELIGEEQRSLQIVCLQCNVKQQQKDVPLSIERRSVLAGRGIGLVV